MQEIVTSEAIENCIRRLSPTVSLRKFSLLIANDVDQTACGLSADFVMSRGVRDRERLDERPFCLFRVIGLPKHGAEESQRLGKERLIADRPNVRNKRRRGSERLLPPAGIETRLEVCKAVTQLRYLRSCRRILRRPNHRAQKRHVGAPI